MRNDRTNIRIAIIVVITRILTYLSLISILVSVCCIFLSGFSDWQKLLFIYSIIGFFIFLVIWRVSKNAIP
jgi:ABC-type multidrug transport system permease subunit